MNDAVSEVEARDLKPGQRIAAGHLPLKAAADVIFVKPYPIHAITRVFVVYEYLDDAVGRQPTPDDFLPDTLIPVTAPVPAPYPAPCGFTLFGVPMHDMPESVRTEVGKILTEAVRDSPGAEARFHRLFELVHGRHRNHDCDPYHCTAP
jgi:hypothetical protein